MSEAAISETELSELRLYQKMYATLVSGMADILKYIQCDMMVLQAYDWNHTREIHCKLVDSLQKAEAIYVERPDDLKA